MSEQGFSAGQGNGAEGNGAANGEGTAPRLQVVAQYVRDLSFENPGAPGNIQGRPQIDFGVDLQARRMENEQFEVELKLRVSAKAEERPIFLLELVYGGMFALHNIAEELAGENPSDRGADAAVSVRTAYRCRRNPRWRNAAADDRADRLCRSLSGQTARIAAGSRRRSTADDLARF